MRVGKVTAGNGAAMPAPPGWPDSLRGRILAGMAAAPEPDDVPLAGISIPDDPRDLDADRWAYYEELARKGQVRHTPDQPPQDHLARWREGTPWFGYRGSRMSPLIFLIVSLVAMAATMVVAFVPRADAPAQTRSLAAPGADVGQIGGLLPAAAVGINGQPRLLRDIRPAVIAVVPDGSCPTCSEAIAVAAEDAAAAGVRLFVAGNVESTPSLEALATTVGAPLMTYSASPFDVYRPAGLTLVLVAPDGLVDDVIRLADGETNISSSVSSWASSPQ